jgi:hypothetical protein
LERDHYLELLRGNYIWTPGSMVYKRAIIESLGGFDARFGGSDDFDLNIRIARHFPVCCCDEVVLEYRKHQENTSRNSALMLKASVSARRAHRNYLPGQIYRLAWRQGIREVQRAYGDELVREIASYLRARQWSRVTRSFLTLVKYYPRGAVSACLPEHVKTLLRRLRRKIPTFLLG